jgi:hypothetical protein
MSVSRVMSASSRCDAGGECFQTVNLEDGSYAFIKGEVPVILRHPLPIYPGEKGSIDYCKNLAELHDEWVECIGTIEVSGDHE